MIPGPRHDATKAPGEALLDALVDRIAAAIQAGRPIDPDAYAEGDPALAGRLRQLLPAIEAMAALGGSPTPTPMAVPGPFRGGDRAGNFRIVREVGRGGMGVVYEAEQAPTGGRVALKVLPLASAMDPRQLARFRAEAQAVALLRHPNILPIHAMEFVGGVHFHVMPFVDGPSLAQVIRDRRRRVGPAPEARDRIGHPGAARLAIQAAEAIAHAHDQGVMHRDIKPANLLIDGRGHLWVADFGLARFRDDAGLTATGDVLGTLRYLSPEQAAGRKVLDPRSDVYALGATLYELLTLRPAFEGGDRQDLLRRVAAEEPAPPRKLDPTIPRDLETIVLKAMAKDPAGRYASADAMADDLRGFVQGRPIRARRPGPLERGSRWVRGHQAAAATAAGVLILALAGLSVGSAMLWREQTRTRGNLDLALRALDDFGLVTGEVGLGRDPERTQELRGLQGNSVRLYERLIRQNPADPGPRWGAARAHECLGNLDIELDRFRDAEAAYRSASALLDGLAGDARGEPRYEQASARVLGRLGTVLRRTGRAREAEGAYRRALAIDRGLVAAAPGVDAYRMGLSRDCINLGLVLGFKVRPEEVGRLFGEALALRRGIAGTSPAARAALAEAHGYLGHLGLGTGHPREAAESIDRAVAIAEALEAEAGSDPGRRLAVAALLETICCPSLCHPSDPGALVRSYRRALASWEGLAADFPTIPDFRARLASAYEGFLPTLAVAGLDGEALPACRRSVEIWGDLAARYPAVIRYRERLAGASITLAERLLDGDRPRDAGPVLERAAVLARDDIPTLSRVARIWASAPDSVGLDPSRASALAETLVARSPGRGGDWAILGVARARSGDWAGARAALERPTGLRGGGYPPDLLLLAKAHWHAGDATAARLCYDRAALALGARADGPGPQVDPLLAEVAALLGRPRTP